jgi:hypothetical protein
MQSYCYLVLYEEGGAQMKGYPSLKQRRTRVAWKLACSHSTADPPAFYLQLFSTTGTALDVSYLLPGLKMTRGPVSILGTPSKYLVFGHQKFCRHKTLNATISLFSTPLERLPTISLPNAIVWRFVRPAVVVGKFEIPTLTTLKNSLTHRSTRPAIATRIGGSKSPSKGGVFCQRRRATAT